MRKKYFAVLVTYPLIILLLLLGNELPQHAIGIAALQPAPTLTSRFDNSNPFETMTVVKAFPERALYVSTVFDSPLGVTEIVADDSKRRLILNTDKQQPQYVNYPPEYLGGAVNNREVQYGIQKAPVGYYIAVCSEDGFFIIDLKKMRFSQVAPQSCRFKWSPDGRYVAHMTGSAPTLSDEFSFYDTATEQLLSVDEIVTRTAPWIDGWSPNWDYYVELRSTDELRSDLKFQFKCGGKIVLQERKNKRFSELCPSSGGDDWFFKWLNNSRLLVYVRDRAAHMYDLFLVDALLEQFKKLDTTPDFQIINNGQKIIRVSWENPICTGRQCEVRILDWQSMADLKIDETFSIQPSNIVNSERFRELYYLTAPPTDKSDYSTPSLKVFNLNSQDVQTVPIQSVNQIGPISPSQRYIPLIIDTPVSQRNIFNVNFWVNPQLVIYDIQLKRITYTGNLGTKVGGMDDDFWSPRSDTFVMSSTVVTLGDTTTALSLNWDSSEPTQKPQWSFDNQHVLLFSRNSLYVVQPSDDTATQIIGPLLSSELQQIRVSWFCKSQNWLLIEVFSDKTIKRWIIDPSKSSRRVGLPTK